MYNRYIPQADGSYRRSRVQEQNRQASPQRPQQKREPSNPPPMKENASCPPQEPSNPIPCPPPPEPRKTSQESGRDDCQPKHEERRNEEHRKEEHRQEEQGHRPPPCQQGGSVGGFLRQLLPRDFDTGDLLIVLLLLLIAGDCAEDQNTALLTLALYFFM